MARPLMSGNRYIAAEFALLKSAKFAAESDSTLLSSRCADLEAKLKEEKEHFDILDANFAELELVKFAAEKEAEKHKRLSDQLQDQLDRAIEDITLLRARDQRAQERIEFLQEELRRKEQELAAKFVELKVENRDFKCGKRRAHEETEQWKRKYCEVQARVLELFDENFALREKTGAVEVEKEVGTHPLCVIEVSDEDGEGKEPESVGAELMSPRRAPVASGRDNGEDAVTIPIGKPKRKRETDVIKKSPASNSSPGKVSPQQLEKRLRVLTPVAIYDVRTA